LVGESPENQAVAGSKGDHGAPEALGHLGFAWRRIPLPVKAQKTAKITQVAQRCERSKP
jgi:hypothetical protein